MTVLKQFNDIILHVFVAVVEENQCRNSRGCTVLGMPELPWMYCPGHAGTPVDVLSWPCRNSRGCTVLAMPELPWMYCPGHAGIKRLEQIDWREKQPPQGACASGDSKC